MAKYSVLIADDHQLLRDGLIALIKTNAEDFEVTGEAANGREAVRQVRRLKPDIVLIDIMMPELNGIEAVKQIVSELPTCGVIAISSQHSDEYVAQMLAAGAKGYVSKESAFDEMCDALNAVAGGDVYLGRNIAGKLVSEFQRLSSEKDNTRQASLSQRELEVLQLVAEGSRTSEIAEKLSISAKTVETHRGQILKKLQLNGIAEMTRYAIRKGIISP